MTQKLDSPQEWLEQIPSNLPAIRELLTAVEDAARDALEHNVPFHSVRISEPFHTMSGRTIGWCVSMTTQFGWEYESAICDRLGNILLMFKNPYVFS